MRRKALLLSFSLTFALPAPPPPPPLSLSLSPCLQFLLRQLMPLILKQNKENGSRSSVNLFTTLKALLRGCEPLTRYNALLRGADFEAKLRQPGYVTVH